MTKNFLKAAVIVILSGCNDSTQVEYPENFGEKKDSTKKYQADTIELARLREMNDSIKKQEQIAFGDLRFGMTKKEVLKISTYQKIGEYDYHISPFLNDEGKLYMIEMQTVSRDANYIDTYVKQTHDNLKDVISTKYGSPTYLNSFPSILDFDAGFIRWTNEWTVGSKKIKLGTGEESGGSTFYTACWIYNVFMYDDQKRRDDEKSKTKKTDDASKF